MPQFPLRSQISLTARSSLSTLPSLNYPPWEPTLVASLLSSIKSFTNQGQLAEAFKAFSLLLHHGVTYSLPAVSSILHTCASFKCLPQGKQLHAHSVCCGIHQHPLLVKRLVAMYSSCGSFPDAHLVVESSRTRDVFPWNVLISAYVKSGFFKEALGAYRSMVEFGVAADNFSYPSVLKACGEMGDLDLGRKVHGKIGTSGLEWNIFVHNALITMYARCGEIGVARQVFDEMPERDVVSGNAMIEGYAQEGMWEQAFHLFETMQLDGWLANAVTWNTIAGGNVQMRKFEEALKLISQMRASGVNFDSVSLVVGLTACSHLGSLRPGKEIHGFAVRSFWDVTETFKNALITMYTRCKDFKGARLLFEKITEKSLISWNAIIAGYAHSDCAEDASCLFRKMVFSNIKPNYVTLASILSVISRVANLQHGKELHCYLIKNSYDDYLLLWNSLVNMYRNSGRISDARRVFDLIPKKDEISYTALIAGYGMQGKGEEAIKLFDEMVRCNIKPDHITMVVVLSACSHSGLVKEGRALFDKMIKDYKIKLRMEHYACIVDLLGRAGLLQEAEEIITQMPFKPSSAMWATLIGACRIHGNMEIGGWAAENLLDMKPENPGYYVLIANMYAAAERWDKLAEVRVLMRNRGLKKPPGCTWIELDNRFHPFLVGDRTNAQAQEIYSMLEGLTIQMKDAGYVANWDFDLEALTK
ncbi:Pentatricopeptide repeat-containing protein [Nymphaea thermarum]|nr:Pentatricopeptide repeat-containing protein [Nymphaea thermarum]